MDENPNYWICAPYCSRSSTICCPFDKIFLNLSPGPFHSANERNYLIKKLLWNISCWQWSDMGTVWRLPRGEAGFTVRKVGEDPRYLPNTIITPPNRSSWATDCMLPRQIGKFTRCPSCTQKTLPLKAGLRNRIIYYGSGSYLSLGWIQIWIRKHIAIYFHIKKNRSVKRYISVFIYWSWMLPLNIFFSIFQSLIT